MTGFGHRSHMLARYPELAGLQGLRDWLREHPTTLWHETEPDGNGEFNVIAQSVDGASVYAARLRGDSADDDDTEEDPAWVHAVVDQHGFTPAEIAVSPARSSALVLDSAGAAPGSILAIRPIVEFGRAVPGMGWEVEVESGAAISSQAVFSEDQLTPPTLRPRDPAPKPAVGRPERMSATDDSLASNDCHHVEQWRSTAEQMVRGAVTNAEKAKKIWKRVRRKMRYDERIRHILEFTHSDNLVISDYRWKGICDEWAVVQITLLRALGVPAKLKFLLWRDRSGTVSHACVEWLDGDRWRHMDALWNAFDDSTVYRARGAEDVTVMDASAPRDARSNAPVWGVTDAPGDQKFFPYGDFVISPRYPGVARRGYSR